MSATKIALLGAIAGFIIFLGLPVGRLRNPAPRLRAMLNAGAVGILVFLLWDVLAHAWEPIDGALGEHHYGSGELRAVDLAAGLGAGLGLDATSVRRLVSGALFSLTSAASDVVSELRSLTRGPSSDDEESS